MIFIVKIIGHRIPLLFFPKQCQNQIFPEVLRPGVQVWIQKIQSLCLYANHSGFTSIVPTVIPKCLPC